MFDAYKGTRKPMPEVLHEQVPLMKEVLTAMGVRSSAKEGYEADDILLERSQSGSRKRDMRVTILSGDRDLLQLSDTHIRICLPKTSPEPLRSILLPGGRDPGVPGDAGTVYRGESPDGRPVRQYPGRPVHR